jgi:hypothetical protein
MSKPEKVKKYVKKMKKKRMEKEAQVGVKKNIIKSRQDEKKASKLRP